MHFTILPEKRKNTKKQAENRPFQPFYTGKNRICAFLCNNLLYILAFLLPCAALLAIMQHFSFAPFGEMNLFVSQGAFYNMTIVTDAIHSLRSGNFHWFTLSGSAGMEYYSTFAYYLCSPFTLVCLLLRQDAAVSLMAVFTVLRISMSAPLMMYYLTHRLSGKKASKYDPSLLIFGLGYALSSYALVQYNDFMFLDIFMLFPLLVLALERLMYRGQCRLFYLLLSVCLFSNFYLGLILIPFMLVYVILKSAKGIRNVPRFLCFSLAAVCTSAVTVLPGMAGMYRSMISTTYVSTSINVRDYFSFFYQHLFYNFPSYLLQTDLGYNLYCGIAVFMLAILSFFVKKQSRAERIRTFALLLFAILSLQFSPLVYAMHLGNSSATHYNAYAFVYLFLLLSLACDALHDLTEISLPCAVIGLLLPILFCLTAVVASTSTPNYTSVQFSVSLMVLYAIVILLFCKKSIRKETLFYFLLFCTTLELLANAFQLYYYVSQSSSDIRKCQVIKAQEPSDAAELPLHSEILNGARQHRTLTYGLNSRYSVNPFISCASAQNFSPLEDAMRGIGSLYVPQNADYEPPREDQYQKTGSYDGYDIYENQYAFPTAYFVQDLSFEDAQIPHNTFFENQNAVAEAFGGDSLYETADFACQFSHHGDTDIYDLGNNIFAIHTNENSEESKADTIAFDVTFTADKTGDLYLWITSLTHFGEVEAGKEYTYSVALPPSTADENVYWIQGAYFDTASMRALTERINAQKVPFCYDGASHMTLEILAETDGAVMTYLPASDYYHVSVDGQKASAYSFENFLSICVPAGQHTVEISYVYPPFYAGLICSLFALGGALAVLLVWSRVEACLWERVRARYDRIADLFSGFCRQNYVYLLSFLIPFVSGLAFMIYYNCEPFGSFFNIFSGDSIQAQFPGYAQHLRLLAGEGAFPAHAWNGAGGYNISAQFPSLHLPFLNWRPIPYSRISSYTSVTWLFTLSLCGPSLAYYLTHRLTGRRALKSDFRLLIASLSYCMCNYFLVMLNNYSWYSAFVLLPLLLLQMDRLMVKGRKRGYIILLSFCVLTNYYITMFICMYLVMRFFTYRFDGIKDFIRKGLRFALCSAVTALPSFNTLYFALNTLAGSTYSKADTDITASTSSLWFNNFSYIFNRQAILASTEGISWNEGNVNLYFGILTLLLVGIYVCAKGVRWQEKLRRLIPYAIFFLALNQPTLNYILNGFHYQNGVPNRFAFLLVLLAATISYDALVAIRRQNWRQILLTSVVCSGVFLISYRISESSEQNTVSLAVTLAFLAVYTLLLLYLVYGRKWRRRLTVGMLLLFVLELNVNAFTQLTLNYGSSFALHYIDAAADLLHSEYGIDNTLERVTNPNTLCVNYSFATDLKGSALFAAGILSQYQLNMASYNGLSTVSNAIQTIDSQTPIGYALSCTRYLIINHMCDATTLKDLKYYEPIAYAPNTIILKNDRIFPFGYYLPQEALSYQPPETTNENVNMTADFWNHLSGLMLGEGRRYADTVTVYNTEHFGILDENWMTERKEGNRTLLHFHVTMPCDGTLYSRPTAFQYIGHYEKGETVDFDMDISSYNKSKRQATDVFVFQDEVFEELLEAICQNPFSVTSFTDDTVTGKIDMPKAGIVNFSMPYDPCWQATVDDAPVEVQSYANAYLCVSVPEGLHTVKLTYVDNRWKLAKLITVLSWIALIGAIVLKDILLRRKKEICKKEISVKPKENDTKVAQD